MVMNMKASWKRILAVSLAPTILNLLLSYVLVMLAVPLDVWMSGDPAKISYHVALATLTYGPLLWGGLALLFALLAVKFMHDEGEALRPYFYLPEGARGKATDALLALALAGLSFLLLSILSPYLTSMLTAPSPEAAEAFYKAVEAMPTWSKLFMLIASPILAGVCEEIIWRLYAITRMEELRQGRPGLPLVLSALLFGLWHGLSIHAVFCFIYGLIMGFTFIKLRRLTPLVIGHWLADVLGFAYLLFWPSW
ncbi:MAG TPA: CPBP family intramembrane metalloprotease [Candidatus Bathyarchaeota archaeon]|nr:CPBP family intramembrane metalloprotease [Candidatus Bathyarchaeota archaeon]